MKPRKKKSRIDMHKPLFNRLMIVLVAFLTLFTMLAAMLTPQRYDITAGEVSSRTITASKDVEDRLTTQRLQDEAVRSVSPSYISDDTVQPEVLANMQSAFTKLLQFRARYDATDEPASQMLSDAHAAFSPVEVSDEVAAALCAIDADTLSSLYERTYAYVREALSSRIPEDQQQTAILTIGRDIIQSMSAGMESADEASRYVDIAMALVGYYLKPNMLLDEETTEANRQRAIEQVEPVVYKKGQNIIRAGEVVTESQIAMLDDLGMLMDKRIDFAMYMGLGLLLAILFFLTGDYIRAFCGSSDRETGMVALLCVIVLITIAFSMLTSSLSPYLMPVTLAAMLTALVMRPRLAVFLNVLTAMIVGLIASVNTDAMTPVSIIISSVISGTIAIPILTRKPQRIIILVAGAATAAANMLGTVSVGLINSASQSTIMSNVIWSAGSGLLSAILCLGLQPALEWLFNLDTPTKLMELSNPNQPLLKRLLIEAPGTYHHSILVANMAEAAATAVGGYALLARVGAYYHDIGKLKRPIYFKENQVSDNPHDRTDPRVSAAILTSHTRDGLEMAQKARLPVPVKEIIVQHHGDSPVLFFYDKAAKQGVDVDLLDFRYPGPLPRTKEAAIVMLADTVEAAVRSIPDITQDKIRQSVDRLVKSKMEDGQLDECELTFADLHKVCEAFVMVLHGVYHERVEYPDIAIPEREKELLSPMEQLPIKGQIPVKEQIKEQAP
ncbi:MAG: HDIG domain-containing protein, partial [Clostridia bacterium]|nr:HDIG domain-containing protein [Clostridia bacterium]